MLCSSGSIIVLLSTPTVNDFFYSRLYVINAVWPWSSNLTEGEALAVHSLGDPTQNATDKVESSGSEDAASLVSSLYHRDSD